MFTACTMASAVEALGMVVPGTASHPAVTAENSLTDQKKQDCVDSVPTTKWPNRIVYGIRLIRANPAGSILTLRHRLDTVTFRAKKRL